jgi:uncharacterized membrane protein YkgB
MGANAASWDVESRIESRLPPGVRRRIDAVDDRVATLMDAYAITALRMALGIVFVWFGALKVADRSPVAALVASTVYWLPSAYFVRFLGVWEIAVGLGLLVPIALRVTLALFWAQMAGTFLVLVVHPGLSFQSDNPLLLTMTGEFVIKNLVLIAAGLVIGSSVRRRHHRAALGDPTTMTPRELHSAATE